MSGAWKSSEGGTITPIGGSSFQSSSAGTHVIVTAGTNVRGVRISTVCVWSGGASGASELRRGATPLIAARYSSSEFAKDLFVPAGIEIDAVLIAGGHIAVTYEIL